MAESKQEDESKTIHPKEDELIEEMIRLCFQAETGSKITWKNVASKNGVTLDVTADACFQSYDKTDVNAAGGLQVCRGQTTVQDITPEIFYEWNEGHQDSHIVWEKEFEKTCTESRAVHYIDDDHTVAYTAYNPGYFVSPRDFVYVKTRRYLKNYEVNGEIYKDCAVGFYYDIGAESPHHIEVPKKHVRAYCIGGYVFCRRDENSPVRLLFVSRMNLAGWIPQWLVNLAIASKCDSINELKQNMKIVVQREMEKRKKLRQERGGDLQLDSNEVKTNDSK